MTSTRRVTGPTPPARRLRTFDPKRQRQRLPRRVPLERLQWVVTPTSAKGPVDPEKAKRYFGLTWQGTYWKYEHCRATGDLYTLQDVPADREPDFFEILRATVLASGVKTNQWTSLHPQMYWPEGVSLSFGKQRNQGVRPGWTGPAPNIGWNDDAHSAYNWYDPLNPGGVAENNALAWGEAFTFAYKDPDNVMRPGMAARRAVSSPLFPRSLRNPKTAQSMIGASRWHGLSPMAPPCAVGRSPST